MPVATLFQPGASQRLIVFQLSASHCFYLAVPIRQVYRVFKLAPTDATYSSGQTATGLVQVEGRAVTAVDLYWHFYGNSQPEANFLLVIEGGRELLGIPLAAEPVLIEVPTSSIRIIPERYRQTDILGLAHHLVQVSAEQDGINAITALILCCDALDKMPLKRIE